MDIIAQLKAERDKVAQQVNALDTGGNTRTPTDERRCTSKNQKARWARAQGQKVVSIAPKRHISAPGLARIRAANRARWAKVRAAKK